MPNVTVTIRKSTPHPNPERIIQPWVDVILREIGAQEAGGVQLIVQSLDNKDLIEYLHT